MQKRPIISRRLLIVATPNISIHFDNGPTLAVRGVSGAMSLLEIDFAHLVMTLLEIDFAHQSQVPTCLRRRAQRDRWCLGEGVYVSGGEDP